MNMVTAPFFFDDLFLPSFLISIFFVSTFSMGASFTFSSSTFEDVSSSDRKPGLRLDLALPSSGRLGKVVVSGGFTDDV